VTRRIGYLCLPHLPAQRALLAHPALTGHPFIVANERVIDASAACLASGVRSGMSVREARELAPIAVIRPAEPDLDVELFERALTLLERSSDGIEPDGLEGAWFRPAGPENLYRLGAAVIDSLAAALGLQAHLGIGPGRSVARITARRTALGTVGVIGDDKAASYLAPLPLALLPLSPSTVERLRLLGIVTIGQFAALPSLSLQRRFGREAALAHRLAQGEDDTPISPRQDPPVIALRHSFEQPIEDRTTLDAATEALLERLCQQLGETEQVCRSLRLQATQEDDRVVERRAALRRESNDPATMLPVLHFLTHGLAPDRPVVAIRLQLEALNPLRLAQGALFEESSAERQEGVRRTLTEVARRYRGRLRRVAPSQTPYSLFEERRLLLLPYQSDDPADPTQLDGEPAICPQPIRLIERGGRWYTTALGWQDEIVALHGCWEADEWWPEETRRTYYRVRTRSGMVAVLAVDRRERRWFLVERVD